MTDLMRVYSGDHDAVIRQFEMDNRPALVFCAEEATLRELVRYALTMAFNDFNFRTLHKEKTHRNADAVEEAYNAWAKTAKLPTITKYLMERLGTDFEDRFVSYFQGPAPDEREFDRWHQETCQMFLDNLDGKGKYAGFVKIYQDLKYGKAQKIVNMMFKHLYCFQSEGDWATRWDPYFRHCHVTLDNFTLEWFKRQIPPYCRIESWSNLEYCEEPVDQNDYLFYQRHIRKFFAAQEKGSAFSDVTPFQAEFYVWPEIQLHLAAEAFLFELNPDKYKGKKKEFADRRSEIIKLPVDELVAAVKNEIQKYQSRQ